MIKYAGVQIREGSSLADMDSPVHFERGPNLLGHRKGEISPRSNGSPANRGSPRGVGSIKKLGGGHRFRGELLE